jgi:hypothetical protein
LLGLRLGWEPSWRNQHELIFGMIYQYIWLCQ